MYKCPCRRISLTKAHEYPKNIGIDEACIRKANTATVKLCDKEQFGVREPFPKGQLISKCPFGVIVWTKIPIKNFPGFLP